MTSSNGNIFRVTGPLCGEFTGVRWIPHTKASDADIWCFLWSAPWIDGWVNNRAAGDLNRHRAHYDVIVMRYAIPIVKHVSLIISFSCHSDKQHRTAYKKPELVLLKKWVWLLPVHKSIRYSTPPRDTASASRGSTFATFMDARHTHFSWGPLY